MSLILTPNETDARPTTRGRLAFARALFAVVLGIAFVAIRFNDSDTKFDELALGLDTFDSRVNYDGDPIHCLTVVTADDCLVPAAARDLPHTIVWLGNSQLHAINQPEPSARTAPVLLAERLRPRGVEVLAFSQPNASLQEHYLLFEYLLARRPQDTLVLPVVFDDMRESSVRATMRVAYGDPDVRAALAGTALGRQLRDAETVDASVGGEKTDETLQDRVEASLNEALAAHLPTWAARPQARGWIAMQLYRTRNSLLNITATSKRRLIPPIYRRNMEALKRLLARARAMGVEVLVYIAPVRNDVEPPYVLAEYAKFKDEVESLAAAEGFAFANLEDLVPAEHWGSKGSTNLERDEEIDFMHFRFPGHVLLEEAIAERLGSFER